MLEARDRQRKEDRRLLAEQASWILAAWVKVTPAKLLGEED